MIFNFSRGFDLFHAFCPIIEFIYKRTFSPPILCQCTYIFGRICTCVRSWEKSCCPIFPSNIFGSFLGQPFFFIIIQGPSHLQHDVHCSYPFNFFNLWLVQMVCHILKRGEKFIFHAPTEHLLKSLLQNRCNLC